MDAAVCRALMRALRCAIISNRAHRDLSNTSGKNEKATVVKQGYSPLLTVHSSGENTAKSSCKQRSFHRPQGHVHACDHVFATKVAGYFRYFIRVIGNVMSP